MKKIFFTILFIVVAVVAFAQAPQSPIKWLMTARMTSETEGVVTLKATVPAGWHLYSTSLPSSDGPKPTVIKFSHPASMTFDGPLKPSVAVVEKEDAMFGVKLAWWDTDVTFTRSFTTSSPADPGKIDISVTFMGCNDETCLPPATVNLSRSVKPFQK